MAKINDVKLMNTVSELSPSMKKMIEDAVSLSDFDRYTVFPGFCDVHVHFREPGFSYKETIKSGSQAAARGGYTAVCAMPNLSPVLDSVEHMKEEQDIIDKDAVIDVLPYAAITVGEKGEQITDIEGLADKCVAFSDDGRGVQDEEMMRQAMIRAKAQGKLIVAHCEDNALLFGGYIHDCIYAKEHGHRGICSKSEWGPIERDIRLCEETGCGYHVCHISAKESVELIRQAKARGVNITCETAPHYLLLDDSMLQEDGRFKMNPPLRDRADREALITGVLDGTVDLIATDHAPHAAEEKNRGLEKSAMGIVGLETSFPLLYTYLVKPGILSLDLLIDKLNGAPHRRFGLGTPLEIGHPADFSVWDLDTEYVIDPGEFQSKGRATPFEGWKVFGRCGITVCNGEIVWKE